jgi:rhodanese-related sulfurtransferase
MAALLFLLLAQHTQDPVETVKAAIEKKTALILDVRERSEWDAGHLESARFVPLSGLRDEAEQAKLVEGLPKDRPLYLHCGSGRRVLPAAEILKKLGFDARPLKQGYAELKESGLK